MQHVIIIGGGLSGTLCTLYLLKEQEKKIAVTLIEADSEQLFRGAAYSSRLPHQLLNVPVIGMSLFADNPDHFWQWIADKHLANAYTPEDFVPRSLFGQYIRDTIDEVLSCTHHTFRTEIAVAENIVKMEGGYNIVTNSGAQLFADKIVLCTGNQPPQDFSYIPESLKSHPFYVRDAWKGKYVNQIAQSDSILIIGTGLTAVDQIMSLYKKGHTGKIDIISRHGFLPHSHAPAPAYSLKLKEKYNLSEVGACLRWLREEITIANETGCNWISVLNAIREMTPQLWEGFSDADKKQFLRHLKPYWEMHRHRVPAGSARVIEQLVEKEAVQKWAGYIEEISLSENEFITTFVSRHGGQKVDLRSKWIINCTGPHADIRKTDSQLIRQLLKSKLVDTDNLSLGIKLGGSGSDSLYIVGPPAKGIYWECTALREIREHAYRVKESIFKPSKTYEPTDTY